MKQINLKNKNVFLTGATGDIGSKIAADLSNHGCNLILNSRNEENLVKLSKNIQNKNKINIMPGDLTDDNVLNKIITKTKSISNVDILINSAGIFPISSLEDVNNNELQSILDINFLVPFKLMREFSKEMIRNKWGRIVNIGSSSSYSGFKNTSVYCASKHALLGASRSIHDELKEHNVRTYCISPSSAQSRMGQKSKDQDFSTFLNPEDVAEFISYIISFDSNIMVEEILLKRLHTR